MTSKYSRLLSDYSMSNERLKICISYSDAYIKYVIPYDEYIINYGLKLKMANVWIADTTAPSPRQPGDDNLLDYLEMSFNVNKTLHQDLSNEEKRELFKRYLHMEIECCAGRRQDFLTDMKIL